MGFVNSLNRLDREGRSESEHNRKLVDAACEVFSKVARRFPWDQAYTVEVVDLPRGYRVARSKKYGWFGFGVAASKTTNYFCNEVAADVGWANLVETPTERLNIARRFAGDITQQWIEEVTRFIARRYGKEVADTFYFQLRELQ